LSDQSLQRRTHRIFDVSSRETVTAELQLSDETRKEDAALLYWQVVGGGPDRPKLRIGQCEHAAMVLRREGMSIAVVPSGVRYPKAAGSGGRALIHYIVGWALSVLANRW
jgi:hypothetical protein